MSDNKTKTPTPRDFSRKPLNVFEAIVSFGDAGRFEPEARPVPSFNRPGSKEKLDEMRQRLIDGEELWHDLDLNSTRPLIPWEGEL